MPRLGIEAPGRESMSIQRRLGAEPHPDSHLKISHHGADRGVQRGPHWNTGSRL